MKNLNYISSNFPLIGFLLPICLLPVFKVQGSFSKKVLTLR
jgi:hypothetical protein